MIIILLYFIFIAIIIFFIYKIKIKYNQYILLKKYWRNRIRPIPLLDINDYEYIINYNIIIYNIPESNRSFRYRYLNYTQDIKYLFFRYEFRPLNIYII